LQWWASWSASVRNFWLVKALFLKSVTVEADWLSKPKPIIKKSWIYPALFLGRFYDLRTKIITYVSLQIHYYYL
jgi:hypothetical protein